MKNYDEFLVEQQKFGLVQKSFNDWLIKRAQWQEMIKAVEPCAHWEAGEYRFELSIVIPGKDQETKSIKLEINKKLHNLEKRYRLRGGLTVTFLKEKPTHKQRR